MLGNVAESMALRRAFPDALAPDTLDGFASFARDLDRDDDAVLVEATARNAIDDDSDDQALEAPFARIDQSEAHRIVGQLDETDRDAFLAKHEIETFGSVWPEAALMDVAGQGDIDLEVQVNLDGTVDMVPVVAAEPCSPGPVTTASPEAHRPGSVKGGNGPAGDAPGEVDVPGPVP
jgi:hypothetical protein